MSRSSFINKVYQNINNFPEKIIISDCNCSLSWAKFFSLALTVSKLYKLSELDQLPIIVDRTIFTPCLFLAAIISGTTFVPISPKQPLSRIQRIITQLDCDLVFNLSDHDISSFCKNKRVCNLSDLKNITCEANTKLVGNDFNALDLSIRDISAPLYILFTSGSTGIPKGVKVSYPNIINTLDWSVNYLQWSDNDKIGIVTNFAFDISLFDIFTGFYFGVHTHVLNESIDPFGCFDEIQNSQITSIFSSPSLFSSFVKSELLRPLSKTNLRQILSGGDFFPLEHVKQWNINCPNIEIYNVWGPTETSIVNTMHRISNDDLIFADSADKILPIGIINDPMMSCSIHDVEDRFKKCTPNEVGEIAVSGNSVSLGYLQDVHDSGFAIIDNKPIFFTDDLGYFDINNRLFIVGRSGLSVKVNGFRVNLKEVEFQASIYDLVNECIAFKDNLLGSITIVVELKSSTEFKSGELRSYLRKVLPPYMIPKNIYTVNSMPKNINGKIDRNQLINTFSVQ